jgi:hypothetical protein
MPFASNSAPELVDSESKDKKEGASSSAEPDAENVKLVMAQAECSEEKAVEALKKADGDLITASTSSPLLFRTTFYRDTHTAFAALHSHARTVVNPFP